MMRDIPSLTAAACQLTNEPAHKILVLIAYPWMKVQNFQNPELSKFQS